MMERPCLCDIRGQTDSYLSGKTKRLPFYSWIRLGFMAYLVLPQTQGAQVLYIQYVEPFLREHERDIEELISRSHERAKALGLQYFYRAIDLIREKVLGLPPQRPAQPPPSSATSYAQSLLSCIPLPTNTGTDTTAPAGDWLSSIGSSLAAMTSTGQSREARGEDQSARGGLSPRDIASMPRAEKIRLISSQRELLKVLGSALSKEELELGDEEMTSDESGEGEPLRENRSENSFQHVEPEDIPGPFAGRRDPMEERPRTSGGGWGSGWFGYGPAAGSHIRPRT